MAELTTHNSRLVFMAPIMGLSLGSHCPDSELGCLRMVLKRVILPVTIIVAS